MALPEPLTPADLDVRGMTYMPLDVVRLRDSDIAALASGDAFRAAVLLWCSSWHQVPAASIPADDANLARYAGYGRDIKGWLKVKTDALRGFVECSDGRLYHPVIAEKAIEADNKRRTFRERASKGGKAKSSRQAVLEADDKHETSEAPEVLESAKCKVSVNDSGGGSARGSLIEQRAHDLAVDLAQICGFQSIDHWPPGWCGSPMWVQKCLNEGWLPDVMRAAAREAVGKKRDGPIEYHIYLEKPLARAHARHQAPLPKVEIPKQETISGQHRQSSKPGGFAGALAKLGDLADEYESRGLSESGQAPPRLLSHG